jgi:hypothetical protein
LNARSFGAVNQVGWRGSREARAHIISPVDAANQCGKTLDGNIANQNTLHAKFILGHP